MNKYLLMALLGLTITGCAGSGSSPGYLFNIIFLIIPLYWIGYSLLKRNEDNTDSLYVIEGQLKRLIERVEKLEKTTNKPARSSRTTKTKKAKTDK